MCRYLKKSTGYFSVMHEVGKNKHGLNPVIAPLFFYFQINKKEVHLLV